MSVKESQISYHAHALSDCLDNLVKRFGDRLEKLAAIDKLDLLAILSFWQSADTQRMHEDSEPISLGEYLDLNPRLQVRASAGLDEALKLLWLADCSEGEALTLMVAIPCQLRDGVYA